MDNVPAKLKQNGSRVNSLFANVCFRIRHYGKYRTLQSQKTQRKSGTVCESKCSVAVRVFLSAVVETSHVTAEVSFDDDELACAFNLLSGIQ